MCFITNLPLVDGFYAILVMIDHFTKMTHFIPCHKATSREGIEALILKNVIRRRGLPDDIISDRGPQFMSHF